MGNVIGIIGKSGSGKTTLICRLLERLSPRRVTVIKRTHHVTPGFAGGKDTDKYLEAGASEAILVTPEALHHWTDERHYESELLPIDQVVENAASVADLVIIESARYDGAWPRILVHTEEIGLPSPIPPLIKAVVTSSAGAVLEGIRQFQRDQVEEIAPFVIRITS